MQQPTQAQIDEKVMRLIGEMFRLCEASGLDKAEMLFCCRGVTERIKLTHLEKRKEA